jgi:DNA-binding beta-propeller fold protein YncE
MPVNEMHRKALAHAALLIAMMIGAFERVNAQAAPAAAPTRPTADYWVYVGAESADLIHRIRFGPAGLVVERTIQVGELPAEMEGPHGLQISRDGKYLHMTTGHGFPDGKYWRYELGPDTLAGPGVLLGNFPASIDVTPDGLYSFSGNFNLHGDMVPSSVSVVDTRSHTEVARIVTCTMPHGSRLDPSGLFHYHSCMMDDQLVEIDARTFTVSRRFSLAKGKERALPATGDDMLAMWIEGAERVSGGKTSDPADVGYAAMGGMKHDMVPNSCSPTWAQPSFDGKSVFVACNKADEIVEIDRSSWSISRRFKTGRGPYNLAVSPDGSLLVATLKQGHMTEVFDLETGKSLAQLRNSTTVAHGVIVTPDSRYAFVTSEGVGSAPGKVDVFDLKALAKVGTVDVGQQASGIAFWKTTASK